MEAPTTRTFNPDIADEGGATLQGRVGSGKESTASRLHKLWVLLGATVTRTSDDAGVVILVEK